MRDQQKSPEPEQISAFTRAEAHRYYRPGRFLSVCAATGLALSIAGIIHAAPVKVAFVAAESSLEAMGPHNRGAWEVASVLVDASLLFSRADGTFVDHSGTARTLDDFDVLWYHQGDAIARTALYSGQRLAAIRRHAERGRGVLLSGGALAMVAQLGLETEIRPQRHDLENYRDPAGMIPLETAHPVFSGLPVGDPVIWISNGGCRAVADFYWGGPAEGMVLATTPSKPRNPLAEYELGKGRLMVFGWHWPDYADQQNPHRANLLRLTDNILKYLANPSSWRPVVIRSDFPNLTSPGKPGVDPVRIQGLRLAITDLMTTFQDSYPKGSEYMSRLDSLVTGQQKLSGSPDSAAAATIVQQFEALRNEALLANPLLNVERLLMIRRRADRPGLLHNSTGNADMPPTGYDNTLVSLSPIRPNGKIETLFKPDGDRFIGDLDLHYDADRLLMSVPDASGRWGVAELSLADRKLTPLKLIDEPDVHNYDACYLPDDRIVFTSTAPFTGVPCLAGNSKVGNLYLADRDGRVRRLTNDQDHNWCPAVLNDGRILYQRWEYADIAHSFTRLLFHANPDGTRQMEFYGSNSYWPTTMFYARPIPDHPTKVVVVVGGHHDAPRQGELVILDAAQGRFEADGVVQRIPGYGKKVEPVMLDGLIGTSWPRFLHPWPLSEKYFLVSCKPTRISLWGIYLVDMFDNFVLLVEEPGYAFLEPIPWQTHQRQPVIPDAVDPKATDASVLLIDIYRGPGLKNVPRGAVKSLRLLSYEFTFHGFGGEPNRVGFDGPWDVKRILGTVPVDSDGSAHFQIPACTPVAIQPLDADGKALALMRSWLTAMPGEVVSCVGCHEPQNSVPPANLSPMAGRRAPSNIELWYGPARGFSFIREVQPVLDAFCIRCHNGKPPEDGRTAFDLTARPPESIKSGFQMRFTPSYVALHSYVNTPTLESDAHLLPSRAFHADTSELVQILRDGHYGVRLSREAWDRIITWIDLNAPAHGTWNEVVGHMPDKAPLVVNGAARRREMQRRYAGIDADPEAVYPAAILTDIPQADSNEEAFRPTLPRADITAAITKPKLSTIDNAADTTVKTRQLPLADGIHIDLVRIPTGEFVMGSKDGYPNERPVRRVAITNAFWLGRYEISNRQYACFDPAHDSGLEIGEQYQFGDDERGHILNRPEQPVVRVSWDEAMAFCKWLSTRTGLHVSLPTETQWEYACRAGTDTALWYGTLDDDFSTMANLSDATHHTVHYPHVPNALPPWRPADTRFDDHRRVSAPVGTFAQNPWGLYDMHGNVSEWTCSTYAPTLGQPQQDNRCVVRGGSWLSRPRRATSAFRLHYEASHAVHDVGFRVICEE